MKLYNARIPGSTYIDQVGTVHQFLGNPAQLETDSAQLIQELDALIQSSKSVNIYFEVPIIDNTMAEIASDAAAQAVKAGVAAAKAGM